MQTTQRLQMCRHLNNISSFSRRQMMRGNHRTFTSTTTRYARSLSVVHSAMAVGVLSCFALIEYKKRQPKGAPIIGTLMHYHKSIGLLMAPLILTRIGLRFSTQIPKALEAPRWMQVASNASHFTLYGAMIFFPTTGILMGYYGGKGNPFFFTKVPGISEPTASDKNIAKLSYKLHKLFGRAFEILVGLHICGAGIHTFQGHRALARISPFAGTAVFALVDDDEEEEDDLFIN